MNGSNAFCYDDWTGIAGDCDSRGFQSIPLDQAADFGRMLDRF